MSTSPRPLVPEDIHRNRERETRAWSRAITAHALASTERGTPEKILRRAWPHDERAALILRSAVTPTALGTSGLPLINIVGEWRSLAPSAAIWKLLAHDSAMRVDLTGVNIVNVPWVVSMSVQPVFVAEGAPAPSLHAAFASTACGPTRKILVLSALSEELQDASPDNASAIISRVLSDAVSRSIDAVAFDANPDNGIRPAGLLNGVTPINAANGTDQWRNTQDDLAALIGAIGNANIDPSDAVFVAGPKDAALIRERSGDLDNDVLMTLGLAEGTIVCVAPQGVCSGYQNGPTVEIGREGSWQFADSSPQDIVGTGGAVATGPVISAFQSYLLGIKVRGRCAWCAANGAVSFVQSANW